MIGSDNSFRDRFLEGAARALFVSAYADFVDELRRAEWPMQTAELRRRYPHPHNGNERWDDYAPPTPPNAYALAGELWEALEHTNKASVYVLAERAEKADGKLVDGNDFGAALAMQWTGNGVSWFDNHARFDLVVPYQEVTLFSFAEEVYLHPAWRSS